MTKDYTHDGVQDFTVCIRSSQLAVLSELLAQRWLNVGLAQIKMSRAMPLQLRQRCRQLRAKQEEN